MENKKIRTCAYCRVSTASDTQDGSFEVQCEYYEKLKVLRKYRKLKVYGEELKALSGSAAKKYRKEYSAELTEYGQIRTKVLELYPSGHIPTVESLDKKINALIQERSLKDQQFREADKRARDLADAQRTIEEFLRQERNEQQQERKRKKNGDLE